MNDKVANILKQVQELPAEERNALIEALAEAEEDCEFASPEIARAWVKRSNGASPPTIAARPKPSTLTKSHSGALPNE